MSPQANRQARLKSRPSGIPQAGHFEIVAPPPPGLSDRQVLVRNEYLSVDPAMRGWVRDGRLRYREDIVDGIEACPGAIAELYRGENLGKRLIRLSHD